MNRALQGITITAIALAQETINRQTERIRLLEEELAEARAHVAILNAGRAARDEERKEGGGAS